MKISLACPSGIRTRRVFDEYHRRYFGSNFRLFGVTPRIFVLGYNLDGTPNVWYFGSTASLFSKMGAAATMCWTIDSSGQNIADSLLSAIQSGQVPYLNMNEKQEKEFMNVMRRCTSEAVAFRVMNKYAMQWNKPSISADDLPFVTMFTRRNKRRRTSISDADADANCEMKSIEDHIQGIRAQTITAYDDVEALNRRDQLRAQRATCEDIYALPRAKWTPAKVADYMGATTVEKHPRVFSVKAVRLRSDSETLEFSVCYDTRHPAESKGRAKPSPAMWMPLSKLRGQRALMVVLERANFSCKQWLESDYLFRETEAYNKAIDSGIRLEHIQRYQSVAAKDFRLI